MIVFEGAYTWKTLMLTPKATPQKRERVYVLNPKDSSKGKGFDLVAEVRKDDDGDWLAVIFWDDDPETNEDEGENETLVGFKSSSEARKAVDVLLKLDGFKL